MNSRHAAFFSGMGGGGGGGGVSENTMVLVKLRLETQSCKSLVDGQIIVTGIKKRNEMIHSYE